MRVFPSGESLNTFNFETSISFAMWVFAIIVCSLVGWCFFVENTSRG